MIRPPRDKLLGMSASEFKTMLKRRGFKIPRDFFKMGCVSRKNDRRFRWRWWADDGFIVDIGETDDLFDRWANSVEVSVNAQLFFETPKPRSTEGAIAPEAT